MREVKVEEFIKEIFGRIDSLEIKKTKAKGDYVKCSCKAKLHLKDYMSPFDGETVIRIAVCPNCRKAYYKYNNPSITVK
jgi:C4-type Zn-finger protein